jgi:hypothetical protein
LGLLVLELEMVVLVNLLRYGNLPCIRQGRHIQGRVEIVILLHIIRGVVVRIIIQCEIGLVGRVILLLRFLWQSLYLIVLHELGI